METLETNEQAYERIVSGLRRYREQTMEAMRLVAEAHEKKIWLQHGLKSFREFCEVECGFTKQWGYSLLHTHSVVLSLTEGSHDEELIEAAQYISPTAARMLEPYDVQERALLVKEAAQSGEVTGKSIAEAIRHNASKLERLKERELRIEEAILLSVQSHLKSKYHYDKICEICTPEFLERTEMPEQSIAKMIVEAGFPLFKDSWDVLHPTRGQELEKQYTTLPDSEKQRIQKLFTDYSQKYGEAITGSLAEQQIAFERENFVFNCEWIEEEITSAQKGKVGHLFESIRALIAQRDNGKWEDKGEESSL